jgi:proline dehydrogenase
VIRNALLAASRNPRLRAALEGSATTRAAAARFVAGTDIESAISAAANLTSSGLALSFDYLIADAVDAHDAQSATTTWHALIERLDDTDLAHDADLTLRLSALGLGVIDEADVLSAVREIADHADTVGARITLGMEDVAAVDATLRIAAAVRADHADTGVTLQANLLRSDADAAELATPGTHVRVCKGAYREPETIAFPERNDVDHSLVHLIRVLMQGQAHVGIATADPHLLEIVASMAVRNERPKGTYEFEFLLGVRPDEQKRLAATGETVRVYVPFGPDWYAYVVRRIAERPANLSKLVPATPERSSL